MLKFSLVTIWLIGIVALVDAIPNYEKFQEGPCQTNVKFMPIFNIRRQMLNSLHHISAGNKYTIYRLASSHPQSILLNEDQLLQNFCPSRNASIGESIAAHFGFGLALQTYFIKIRAELPGVYQDLIPREGLIIPQGDTLRQYVTLTDDKNFAVIYNCWTGTNKRGWMVISRSPKLDVWTTKTVENHVKSLGFRVNNAVFYDRCPTVMSPFLRGDYMDLVIPTRNPPPINKGFKGGVYNKRGIFADYLATTTKSTVVPDHREANFGDHSLNAGGSLFHESLPWLP